MQTAAPAVAIAPRQSLAEVWTKGRVVLAHGGVVGLIAVLNFALDPPATMMLGGAFMAIVLAFLGYVEAQRDPFWITPVSMYFLWNVFGLGFAAIYMGTLIADGSPLYFSGLSFIAHEDLATGYVVSLVGSWALHAGLQSARPRPTPPMPVPEPQKASWLLIVLFLLWAVSVAQMAFPTRFVRFGTPATALQFGGHTALVVFALLPPQFFRMSKWTHGFFLLAGTSALFASSSGANSKLYFMISLVPLFCLIVARKTMHKYVPAIAVLAIFAYLTVVAPTVNLSRQTKLRGGETMVDAQIDAFQRYSPLATGSFDTDFYAGQFDALLRRQYEPISVGYLVGEVKRHGFLYGETMKSIGINLIPRVFWPDKPNVIKGAWFAYYTGGSPREAESTYSVGMEAAGELYWNFGIAAVLVGMFVLGAMFGGLWRMAGYDTRFDPAHHLLYMTIALGMVNLPEASSRYVSCIALFLIFGVTYAFLDYRKNRVKRVPVMRF